MGIHILILGLKGLNPNFSMHIRTLSPIHYFSKNAEAAYHAIFKVKIGYSTC